MTDNGNAAVVPFGKYKGQPVEVLMADAGYRDWAMAQPWFRDRYPAVYQVIVNYGAEPADTPEHNAMQAAFLDDELCLRLCAQLWETRLRRLPDDLTEILDMLDVGEAPRLVYGRRFEAEGWDVRFEVEGASFEIDCTAEVPACSCSCANAPNCESWCVCRLAAHQRHAIDVTRYPCDPACPWSRRPSLATVSSLLRGEYADRRNSHYGTYEFGGVPLSIAREADKLVEVELKPDLGDDFPAVLRQVLNYKSSGRRCVVVRRAQFEQVTWEQVVEMFAASNVWLLRESELSGQAP